MEAEQLLNMNHYNIGAPGADLTATEQMTKEAEPAQGVLTLEALWAKREQLIQGLNGAIVRRDTEAQSVARTEGALMYVNQLITELDPDAFKQQGG